LRDANLQVVKENFIPVALDLQTESGRQDAAGEFFRSINKTDSHGLPKFTGASGRIHGMTAGGKFLCGDGKNNSCRDCNIAAALKRWNDLPEVERKPGALRVPEFGKVDAKIPTPPPGGLILKVYQSRLQRDAKHHLERRSKYESFGWGVYEPGLDYFWLSEAEWKSLLPDNPKKGDRSFLPAALAGRLARHTLTDGSEANPVHWEKKHVRSLELTLTVTEASADAIQLRLEGSIRLAGDAPKNPVRYHPALRPLHHEDPKAFGRYDAHVLGRLNYDKHKKAFTRFDIVAVGDYVGRMLNPYRTNDGQSFYFAKTCPLGVAFEIAPPNVNVPPRGCHFGID
jgi:hypothetical protein